MGQYFQQNFKINIGPVVMPNGFNADKNNNKQFTSLAKDFIRFINKYPIRTSCQNLVLWESICFRVNNILL